MPKYNREFDLTIADIDLIETALQQKVDRLSHERLALLSDTASLPSASKARQHRLADLSERLADLHDLLGRLHNQKTFYRPSAEKQAYYVSG